MNFNQKISFKQDKNLLIIILIVCSFFIQVSCRKPFEPTLTSPQTGYLVVEGLINIKGVTTIKLSRTRKLEEQVVYKPELKASVQIVGENLAVYEVKEKSDGTYESEILELPDQKYHLTIKTAEGKEYESNLVEKKITPPIDSIAWTRTPNGVEIKVNSHDDQNKTKYYKWTYDEVWEIRSAAEVDYKFVRNIDPYTNTSFIGAAKRTVAEKNEIYYCWQYNSSKQILLGSSAKLSKDIISFPLNFIPDDNPRLEILYSIKVKQVALDLDGYNFYFNLKSNTETNGSIFDRQPTETTGNIICISNPQEQVIGYVGLGTIEEKRIFIPPVPNWKYKFLCYSNAFEISSNQDTLAKYAPGHQPVNIIYNGATVLGYQIISNRCIDCTFRGNNTRPSFWPY